MLGRAMAQCRHSQGEHRKEGSSGGGHERAAPRQRPGQQGRHSDEEHGEVEALEAGLPERALGVRVASCDQGDAGHRAEREGPARAREGESAESGRHEDPPPGGPHPGGARELAGPDTLVDVQELGPAGHGDRCAAHPEAREGEPGSLTQREPRRGGDGEGRERHGNPCGRVHAGRLRA